MPERVGAAGSERVEPARDVDVAPEAPRGLVGALAEVARLHRNPDRLAARTTLCQPTRLREKAAALAALLRDGDGHLRDLAVEGTRRCAGVADAVDRPAAQEQPSPRR